MSSEKARFPLLAVDAPLDMDFLHDHVGSLSTEMSCVHNCFIRSLNSMHYNASRVKAGEQASFVGYCLVFCETLHQHHSVEEELVFPCLQSKFDMQSNVDQHRAFDEGLHNYEEYLKNVEGGKATYDGEKVVQLLEAFGDHLVQHLNDEIPTIVPERLAQIEKADLDRMFKELEKRIKSDSLTRIHVFYISHHDFTSAPGWPAAPKVLVWIVMNVAYWRYKGYWKFAPFDRHHRPLEYASE